MRVYCRVALALTVLLQGATAFVATSSRTPTTTTTQLSMQQDSRRAFLARVAATTTAALALTTTTTTQPALALGGGIKKINTKLLGYGLPPFSDLPDGFSPLAELYGKASNRFPILVRFCHPFDWIVVLPSIDQNGEDGTIQAGEYAKGDSATFFVYNKPGNVPNIASQPKDFFQEALIKAISQKGDNVYQNFKITKIDSFKTTEYKDQEYVLVDFKYELLTGAGFEVDRIGVASITSSGDAVELLWAASTRQRYKKTESTLRNIVGSFRCYTDGLKLSGELVKV